MAAPWRPGRDDRAPLALILLLPLAVAAPQLLGLLLADPALYVGSIATGMQPGVIPGVAFIDPNNGFTTQALGYRAALEWLQGTVPWWNYYSGVGLPLAAEYQPAAFFPLTFLLLLPKGMVLQQLALQMLTGVGTYGLLRQTGIGRLAATTGAILYSFNGTLAWFAHGPAQPVPFLPWMLWAIERAQAKSVLGLAGGWRMLAFAMAMSLLAGFPETAYLSGLLALAWTVVRGVQAPAAARAGYAWRVALGGVVGIAIAAPQVLAFFLYLPEALLGGHAGEFAHASLMRAGIIPSLIAPYAHGPIFGAPGKELIWAIWGGIGGYVTLLLAVLAVYGFATRRTAIGWLLAVWTVLALLKTFGVIWASILWNLIPGISLTAFMRYAQPSWELAFVLLAAWGLDDLARRRLALRGPWLAACAVPLLAVAACATYGGHLWPDLAGNVRLRNWALISALWAALTALVALCLVRAAARAWAAPALAALLAFDAVLMFAIPTLSNPRAGTLNMPAITFMREHAGLQRVYSLGPMQPNYGAYFGIASINHNYLPVARRWVEWVNANLDRHADPTVFNGDYPRPPGLPTQAQELRAKVAAYEWAGVKLVMTRGDHNPFVGMPVPRVYSDPTLSIFELPGAKPYFEALSGECRIEARTREQATIDCAQAGRLMRRELYFPGWAASVNGAPAPIAEHRRLFQEIAVPAGRSLVRFSYAPPHVAWAWLAAALALITLAASAAAQAWRRRAPGR